MLIEIKNDVYFILSRLREIDEGYKIFYNTCREKFEIHNEKQVGNSYCLTVPHNVLDCRTVEHVRKTRVENVKTLFEEMEKQNLKLEKNSKNYLLDEANQKIKECLKNYKII